MLENSTVKVLITDLSLAGEYHLEVKYDGESIQVQPRAFFQVVRGK